MGARIPYYIGLLPLLLMAGLVCLAVLWPGAAPLPALPPEPPRNTAQDDAIDVTRDVGVALGAFQRAALAHLGDPATPETARRFETSADVLAVSTREAAQRMAGIVGAREATDALRHAGEAATDEIRSIVALGARRDALAATAVGFGSPLAEAAGDIMRTAWRTLDIEALYKTNLTLEPMNESLILVERLRTTADPALYDKLLAKLAEAAEMHRSLAGDLTGDAQMARAASLERLLGGLRAGLVEWQAAAGEYAVALASFASEAEADLAARHADLEALVASRPAAPPPIVVPQQPTAAQPYAAYLLAGAALLLAIGTALALLVDRRMAGALRRLADDAEAVAAGGTPATAPGVRETGALGVIAGALQAIAVARRERDAADAEQERLRTIALRDDARRDSETSGSRDRSLATLRRLTNATARMADGDLTVRIGEDTDPEARDGFNAAIGSLDAALAEAGGRVAAIEAALAEAGQASRALSDRVEQQAASAAKTVSDLAGLAAGIEGSAAHATRAQGLAMTARDGARHGGAIIGRTVETMATIEKSSVEIGAIIAVIDGIAFQTSLLALNAGVEAARAGDAGRGFAVVAQEVRSLAQRSAEAATQIKRLVTASHAQVRDGVALAAESGRSLEEVAEQVAEIDTLIGAVAGLAREQATALRDMTRPGERRRGAADPDAAMIERSLAVGRFLQLGVQGLSRMLGAFRTSDEATAAPPRQETKRPWRAGYGGAAPNFETMEDWAGF